MFVGLIFGFVGFFYFNFYFIFCLLARSFSKQNVSICHELAHGSPYENLSYENLAVLLFLVSLIVFVALGHLVFIYNSADKILLQQ